MVMKMPYEPELNDPIFYGVESEIEPTRCFRCSDVLEEDDIVWATYEGQIIKHGNDTAWCVACLDNEEEMGD